MKHPADIAFRSAGLTTKKRFVQIALLNVFLMLMIPSLCAGTTLRVLDSEGNVGWEPSIAINGMGLLSSPMLLVRRSVASCT